MVQKSASSRRHAECRRCIGWRIVVSAFIGLMTSCQTTDFDRIPRTGFVTHYKKTDHSRMPFDSYWDISDNTDWDQRVLGEKHKSNPIYVAPVTLEYFDGMPPSLKGRREIEKLAAYFDARLKAVLGKLDAQNNTFHLVAAPQSDAYTVQIALLSAKAARPLENIAGDAAGFFVRGAGLLTATDSDSKGSISMGARYYAPGGKLVAEVADFQYGRTSLFGMLLVDLKDFSLFAYQRRTIDQWVDEFAKLFTTTHATKVKKPLFSLNPV